MTREKNTIPRAGTTRQPRVSIVVPVYNRSQELRQLLSALVRQALDPADIEVLICDDGSTEDLSAITAEFKEQTGFDIIHLRQSRQGAGIARNLGLAHARSEIVAFTDSDCIPDAKWLSELMQPFEDPGVGIVGGPYDYHTAEYLSGQCVNFLMSSMLGAGGARDPRSAIHMKYYPRTGNLAVRRKLAEEVGGFSSRSHGEDLEFSHAVSQLGVCVEFVPSAKVVHNEKRTVLQVAREAFKKGVARVRLAERHGMHELIHTLPALFCLYLLLSPGVCAAWPNLVPWCAIPACLYAAALSIVAFQGALAIADVRAAALVPLYALIMHLGYGLGYIRARCGSLCYRSISVASRTEKMPEVRLDNECIQPVSASRDRSRL